MGSQKRVAVFLVVLLVVFLLMSSSGSGRKNVLVMFSRQRLAPLFFLTAQGLASLCKVANVAVEAISLLQAFLDHWLSYWHLR